MKNFSLLLPALLVGFCPFVCTAFVMALSTRQSRMAFTHAEDALQPLQMFFGECERTLLGIPASRLGIFLGVSPRMSNA